MIYLVLFYEFLKIGLFAVGGGLATLPFLYDLAAKYPTWFTETELMDMLAVSESTPGPVGINMATYAGFQAGGILGGAVATLALVLPSLIIIMIIANFLKRFSDSRPVQDAFSWLRPVVTGMIAVILVRLCFTTLIHRDAFVETGQWTSLVSLPALGLFALLAVGAFRFPKMHPILWIGIGAVGGVVFRLT